MCPHLGRRTLRIDRAKSINIRLSPIAETIGEFFVLNTDAWALTSRQINQFLGLGPGPDTFKAHQATQLKPKLRTTAPDKNLGPNIPGLSNSGQALLPHP